MLILVLAAICGLVALALSSSIWGNDGTVLGSGNAFESYYGKSRWDPGQSPPCARCIGLGCIGAGECRCSCHRPFPRKKK